MIASILFSVAALAAVAAIFGALRGFAGKARMLHGQLASGYAARELRWVISEVSVRPRTPRGLPVGRPVANVSWQRAAA